MKLADFTVLHGNLIFDFLSFPTVGATVYVAPKMLEWKGR